MNKNIWLFPQNSCSIKQFFTTLRVFGELNGISRNKNIQQTLMEKQKKEGLYNPYIEKNYYDTSSANHKIDEPRFYGAIFETPNKKIHVSSYGELLLKYENNVEKRNKVFIAMLYRMQFNHPFKRMKDFDIYPMRLFFELLREKKLNYELSNLEIALILYTIKNVANEHVYSKIVEQILKFRNLPCEQKLEVLKNNAEQFIKNCVSCNYLINILFQLGIIHYDKTGEKFRIKSPVRAKSTTITTRMIKLDEKYEKFVDKYKKGSSMYEETIKINGLKSEWIREIYNTVPELLLNEIEEIDDMYTQYLQIPKILVESSVNPKKWNIFEEYITKSFNLFEDINAETISGPGEPDTLCKYLKDNTKFCADGKSTHKKLSEINDGRLKQHREVYNAQYTIIVTPGYVPSAVSDIKDTNTCIITSYCFADLITKYIFKLYKNHEECSYEIFNNLVLKNLGTDVSEKIYKIIDDKLGVDIDNI